eukprot:250806-Amorphochlora_amoeboformis.AAC.1
MQAWLSGGKKRSSVGAPLSNGIERDALRKRRKREAELFLDAAAALAKGDPDCAASVFEMMTEVFSQLPLSYFSFSLELLTHCILSLSVFSRPSPFCRSLCDPTLSPALDTGRINCRCQAAEGVKLDIDPKKTLELHEDLIREYIFNKDEDKLTFRGFYSLLRC